MAAEIAEIEEVRERCRNDRLGSVNLLFGYSAEHCFELVDQIQRTERPGAELVLLIDFV